ncbi:hypothetical protein J6590_008090 [Homalodisca vitripennis]|nr:hypothetical protein J6590_008090 [Homalodisca vitripennis]
MVAQQHLNTVSKDSRNLDALPSVKSGMWTGQSRQCAGVPDQTETGHTSSLKRADCLVVKAPHIRHTHYTHCLLYIILACTLT